MSSSIEMDEKWRYTLLVNQSDINSELVVDYSGVKYTLAPKGYSVIRWKYVDQTDTTLPLLRFWTGDKELHPGFSSRTLYEYKRIVIFGDLVESSSCQLTLRTDPKSDTLIGFWSQVHKIMRTMGELEKKVRIWHNQCKHLLKKYQEAVERVERLNLKEFWDLDLESIYMDSQNMTCLCSHLPICLDGFINPFLITVMLEGEALLRSCGERFYNQSAFALTSAPPCVPTFSKFALAIRDLSLVVDFLCCVTEKKTLNLASWEWCEERCRLVNSDFTDRLDASEDDSLEADVRRQNADREAFRSSLDLKLGKSPGTSFSKFLNPATWLGWRAAAHVQGELESIWRKRLQASSCAPGSYSPLDTFVIENPDTSFVEVPRSRFRSGTSKSVQKCKWLGQPVAVSTMSNISKVSAQAETGFLARVQHPNVVSWMGYAFKADLRDADSYRECFLVTEHMECDMHDLITERLTRGGGKIVKGLAPFGFWVALDIASQIVEAMIHLHRCRVIHRDLKPKNILASRKDSPNGNWNFLRYSIKLIDFGSSKSGDQDSHFQTRKQGTPVYMAPEVWESEASYSWSADVYSFGLTCFEIFTGRLPLEDGMPRTHANIQKVLRGEIIFPFDYPAELKSLIVKCWAQDPSDRPCFEDIRKALWRLKVLYWAKCPYFLGVDWW